MRPRIILFLAFIVMISSLFVFRYYDDMMAYLVFAFGFVLFLYARILMHMSRMKPKRPQSKEYEQR